MTKIAVDCEFNGFGGQLISMALVTEHGDEWYKVLDYDLIHPEIDPWVRDNVMPVLFADPISKDQFRESLKAFLERQHKPVIVADWYTDLMHFFQCFQGQDHSQSMHIPLKAELLPDMKFIPSDVPHNALFDARSIMATIKLRRSQALDELGALDGEELA